ncbi:MAG: VWA domain-containing protein [Verrucomicrobiaceae bacterium]|nr:VWA domain-containing protein [Verrucomicrobiaceae bacterium]
MKTHLLLPIALSAFTLVLQAKNEAVTETATAPKVPTEAQKPTQAQKRVEVCFVLDTTGSMSGLIEGAKQKIWSIANDIISAKPKPQVRFGLVGYRDRGDAYVTRPVALTDDLDALYADLQKFRADGGGDTPESVSEALHEAVSSMQWSDDPDTFRVVYLVGDAPPQQYADGKHWPKVCKKAGKKDILINTIQCGNIAGTAEVWKAIASSAGGAFAVIPQDGNMQHIAAPQDKELMELNIKIGATLIPCGTESMRQGVLSKQSAAEAAAPAANASRLAFNWKSAKTVQGTGELIDAIKEGKKKLEEVKADELPENLRKLSPEDLKAHVAKQQAEREAIQKRIADLVKARDAHILAERQKLAASGKTDSFDEQVTQTLHSQASSKNIRWE